MVKEIAFVFLCVVANGASVDFVYFEGQAKHQVDVPFGLHGACRSGVSAFAEVGVLLEGVTANGKAVNRRDGGPAFVDERFELVVRPGSSYQYQMALDRLVSEAADPRYSFEFVVPGLPRSVDVTYRIRCADGSVSEKFVTRGRRFGVPVSRQLER
jgi:hypothetical protein